jgi:polysaccharide export outer membrane protein
VYSANFSDPAGYFLATKVQMRDKDVIFAANAQAVEITKFAAFANTIMSVPANGIGLASSIQTNRILFHTPNPTTSTTIVGTPATP